MRTLTLEDLCIHQVCLSKQCGFVESLECLARHGITKTAIWRPMLDAVGIRNATTALQNTGVSAISLCPLVLHDPDSSLDRQAQREQNQKCLEEAAKLDARSVVTITGGLNSAYNNIAVAREAAVEELSRLIPKARELGLSIALEPLLPMVCGMRSVISTLDEAGEILDVLTATMFCGLYSTPTASGGMRGCGHKSSERGIAFPIFMFRTGFRKRGTYAWIGECQAMD